jgi:hypothetical protein
LLWAGDGADDMPVRVVGEPQSELLVSISGLAWLGGPVKVDKNGMTDKRAKRLE